MTTTLNISPQGIPVTNHGNEFLENVGNGERKNLENVMKWYSEYLENAGNGMLKKLESMRNSFSELSNHYAVLY